MAELALRTTERYCEKTKYIGWRPVGSIIVAINQHKLRRKWLEIICDLVRPSKREQYRSLPGYKRLCEAWTQELWDEWFALNRPTKDYPLGPLLQNEDCAQKMWNERIVPLGLPADLPFAPEADLRVCETWLWSTLERKNYFIITNQDTSDDEIKTWGDVGVEWDMDTNKPWEKEADGRAKNPTHRLLIRPRKIIKYATDIGLSGDTLTKIADKEQVLHPRFDAPITSLHVKEPEIAEMPKVVR